MPLTYAQAQSKPQSRKIILATVNSSKRLMGWALHSGSIYKLTDFDFSVIVSLERDGTALSEVSSLSSVTLNTFYNDRANKILYSHITGGANPNSVFMALTNKNFYSNIGVSLPNDLASGFEVYWLPLIKGRSKFGVELDNSDQVGVAIEGSGQISFFNDRNYWDSRYDKLVWRGQDVEIFSTFSGLAGSEAKKLYEGKVENASNTSQGVTFRLKDLISEFKQELSLGILGDIAGARIPPDLENARDRKIYGRVFGHRCTSLDQVLTGGYPLAGTVTISNGSKTLTGSGTSFLTKVARGDTLIIQTVDYVVDAIASNTSLTLVESFEEATIGVGVSITIRPEFSKDYTNRTFNIAGHALREPLTSVTESKNLKTFVVADTSDIIEGDELFIGSAGSGEVAIVSRVRSDKTIVLTTNLLLSPPVSTAVKKTCVQNVRINDNKLVFDRDYTLDADSGILTLKSVAEFNFARVRKMSGTLSVTSGVRTATGSGTSFTKQLKAGDYVRVEGNAGYFKISEVVTDTALVFEANATYTDSGVGQYKDVNNFNEESDVLSCDAIGTTVDGTKEGALADTSSDIIKTILTEIGLASKINTASFAKSKALAPQKIGFVFPDVYTGTESKPMRDIISDLNKTIFATLIQNNDFEFYYNILTPSRPTTALKFQEKDIFNLKVETDNENIKKTVVVRYLKREYDYLAGKKSFKTSQKTSDIATKLVKVKTTKTIESFFITAEDARISASRWSFVLENGSNIISFSTKMRASRLQIGSIIDISHSKLYERIGGGKRKLVAIQSIKKNHSENDIECEDLSNSFNRVAAISVNGSPDFDNSSGDQKFFNSFITDSFGLINNDADTHGLNLIW